MKESLNDPTTSMRRPSAFETQISLATKPEGPLRASNLRFIALGLISIVSFGASFSTYSTLALEYNQGDTFLASLSPYFFFPLFGGAIIDKWSVRGALGLFGAFIAVGSFCLFLSGGGIIVGAVLIEVGAGCLLAAQATIAAKWFRNKELALAIGSYLCMSKIGGLLGYTIVFDNYDPNYNSDDSDYNGHFDEDLGNFESLTDTQQTIFNVGLAFGLISFIAIIALIGLDQQADEQDSALCKNQGVQQNVETGPIALKNYPLVFHLLASSILIQGVFISLDNAFFNELVNSSKLVSDQVSGMQFYTYVGIIFALLFPAFGFLVDRFGKKTLWLWVSSVIFAIICIIAVIAMFSSGVSYGSLQVFYIILDALFQPIFLCIIWFCIPLVFEQKIMGIGAGIAISITNLMVFTSSSAYYFLLDGDQYSNDHDDDSDNEDMIEDSMLPAFLAFVFIISIFGIISSIWLHREDERTGGKLANPSTMKMVQNSSKSAFL